MKIKVTIERKKVKNLNLSVRSGGIVKLSVPFGVSNSYVEDFLKRKEEWILKAIDRVGREAVKKVEYNVGSKIEFLGRRYELQIFKSDKKRIVLTKGKIMLHILQKDERKIEKIIYEWYLEQAEKIFESILKRFSKVLNLSYERLKIRKMKNRWGSCRYNQRVITLNLELIKKSPEMIKYVAIHELAHLKYPHHGKEFWSFVERYLPDWKILRERLNEND